ncbi:ANTAR domain-containing protein [Shewanella sp. SG41-4]|uniref:ANTAR domain-containing response regulator n=1 Tax=Shewanella sp. SG41-4 TaxID=2760976 RepID=UPI0015FF32BD|nr:ANTAR domain-containing protein [Shewanella sp. SG41-4]MBB1439555.1 ANTAR domain-containing protein [Shewanella sp. SG41-4]
MRSLIFCDPSFSAVPVVDCEVVQYQSCLATFGHVTVLTSVSQIEQRLHQQAFDTLLILTDTLHAQIQGLIQRTLTSKPMVIVVNAKTWQQTALTELLDCGRITFIPETLSVNRLISVISLAQARFNAASKTLVEFKKLADEIRSLKLLSQAKLIVMQQGFDETKAHQIIQQQAMQKGLSLAQMSAQIIAVVTRNNSPAEPLNTGANNDGAPHFGAVVTKMDNHRPFSKGC